MLGDVRGPLRSSPLDPSPQAGPVGPPSGPRRRGIGGPVRTALTWTFRAFLVALGAISGLAFEGPWGPVVDAAIGALLGLAALGLGHGLYALLAWTTGGLARAVGAGTVAAAGGLAVLSLAFMGTPPVVAGLLTGIGLLACGGVVAAVVAIRASGSVPVRVAVATLGLATSAVATGWWFWPGGSFPTGSLPPIEERVPVTEPGEPDPVAARLADPGPYPTAGFAYGDPASRFARAVGRDAVVPVPSVDLSDRVELSAVARPLRALALGHGPEATPRNALVTYPVGVDGPAPLALIVHGNANLFVRSEAGYAAIAERLASHGTVVASVDASTFNALPIVGGLDGENDARALQLLAHLHLWSDGSLTPGADGVPNDLPAVDPDRIALIGHSRGGEAATLAAVFDRLGALPDDARRSLSERFGGPYRPAAVVAIAPSDQQHRPGDRPARLIGPDYLVLHAGHDADVFAVFGDRQYERTDVAPGGLRASVFLHRATHSGFNDRWGPSDVRPPLDRAMNATNVMDPAAQQGLAATLTAAFLERSLNGNDDAAAIFRDPATLAAHAPPGAVRLRFDDGRGRVIAGFQEDVDPRTGTLPGTEIEAAGLTVWREADPRLRRDEPREANVAHLGWRASEEDEDPPYWQVTRTVLPLPRLQPGDALRLELAAGTEPLPGDDAPPHDPPDAWIELIDDEGRVASVRLSEAGPLPRALPTRFTRLPAFATDRLRPAAYPLLQRLDVPVASFLEREPELDLDRLRTVRLRFDATVEGSLLLRSLAFGP